MKSIGMGTSSCVYPRRDVRHEVNDSLFKDIHTNMIKNYVEDMLLSSGIKIRK